jgi:predicted small integral membrane protein
MKAESHPRVPPGGKLKFAMRSAASLFTFHFRAADWRRQDRERAHPRSPSLEIARRRGHQMYMAIGTARIIAIALAIGLIAAGCWRASPAEQMKAAIEAQCKAGTGPCPDPKKAEMTIKCQAGDPVSCQTLAINNCESGDRLSCQSLAVTYTQLNPLCKAGNPAACRTMNLPWPDRRMWNPQASLAQAQSDCKAGKSESCRALSTHAQSSGNQIIWTQSFVEPAKKN